LLTPLFSLFQNPQPKLFFLVKKKSIKSWGTYPHLSDAEIMRAKQAAKVAAAAAGGSSTAAGAGASTAAKK